MSWGFSRARDYPPYCSPRVHCTGAHFIILLKETCPTSHPMALFRKGKAAGISHNWTRPSAALIWDVLGVRSRLLICMAPSVLRPPDGPETCPWGLSSEAGFHPACQPRPPGRHPPDHRRPPWHFVLQTVWTTSFPHSRLCCSRPNSKLIIPSLSVSLFHRVLNERCVALHVPFHCPH